MAIKKKSTPSGELQRIMPDSIAHGVPTKDGADAEAGEAQLAVDVFQTPEDIIVVAPLAGVRVKDVSLSTSKNVLTIRGQRAFRFDIPQENYFVRECFWGGFSRAVILPESVDMSKISAHFRDGVLTVKIPKIARIGVRTISIQTE